MPPTGRKAKSKIGTRVKQHQGFVARAVDEIQDLAREYIEFREEFLPALRRDLKSGMTEEQLRNKYAAFAQARIVNIALMEPNASVALAAAEKILDRKEGKARERIDHTHRLAQLPEEQLDALLLSEMKSLEGLEGEVDAEDGES